ncbi:hypothetical protein [Pyxidicoccus trucidator]|uniref:hypothetical protein n=1 Tax=Pyxidicoccus trucidator TaxID=2709662 RepID=UPI0019682001|nr:hypothetical protein [Pyxidicoccus trucidator]
MATKKKAARKAPAKKSPTKKGPAKKAARKAPAKRAPAKKAARKASAKKAPAKKAARKAPAKRAPAKRASAKKKARAPRRPRNLPKVLTVHEDRFEPENVIVRRGQWVHLTSGRDDKNVPVQVPECFGLMGPQLLKKRGALLKLQVIKGAQLDTYPIQAPRKGDPHTDIKGEIEVVSKD